LPAKIVQSLDWKWNNLNPHDALPRFGACIYTEIMIARIGGRVPATTCTSMLVLSKGSRCLPDLTDPIEICRRTKQTSPNRTEMIRTGASSNYRDRSITGKKGKRNAEPNLSVKNSFFSAMQQRKSSFILCVCSERTSCRPPPLKRCVVLCSHRRRLRSARLISISIPIPSDPKRSVPPCSLCRLECRRAKSNGFV